MKKIHMLRPDGMISFDGHSRCVCGNGGSQGVRIPDGGDGGELPSNRQAGGGASAVSE